LVVNCCCSLLPAWDNLWASGAVLGVWCGAVVHSLSNRVILMLVSALALVVQRIVRQELCLVDSGAAVIGQW
jgi:hypothetical protein